MSVSGYIYLCLLGGKTHQFSTSRPGICMLACRLQARGFLVDVYPYPTNTFESIQPDIWRYIVMIVNTLLVIILPAAVTRKYEFIWYANSFYMSDSLGNSSHVDLVS